MLFAGDALIMAGTILGLIYFHFLVTKYKLFGEIVRPLKTYALYISPLAQMFFCYVFEVYQIRKREKLRTFTLLLIISVLSTGLMFAFAKVMGINQTTFVYVFLFYILCLFFFNTWRLIYRTVLLSTRKFVKQKVLFIGNDLTTEEIVREMKRCDYKLIGILLPDTSGVPKKVDGLRVVGSFDDLSRIVHSKKVGVIVTSLNFNLTLPQVKNLYRYKNKGKEVYDSAHFYEVLTGKFAIEHYLKNERIPYFNVNGYSNPTYLKLKRFMDVVVAASALVVLSPFFLLTMILVKLSSKGPIFYIQERVGFQEYPFRIIKFRTMVYDAEEVAGPRWACKNDSRITNVGKVLRKMRLDELPQLLSIIKGDMSFVGPRPFRKYFVDMFEEHIPFYSLKFSIKPGLTGWAQVNHNYSDDKQTLADNIERLQYDLYYLKHGSLFLDIFIILKTFQAIVLRPGY